MTTLNLKGLGLTRPEKEVPILDKFNEPSGLVFKIRPKTDEAYQRVQRQVQDQFSSGKKLSAARRRELGDRLFTVRVSGWRWEGKAKKTAGEPEFTPDNLQEVLYRQGESSAAIREQLAAAINDDEEVFVEE